MIFSHLMMSRMLLSSSCVLVFLLCLSHKSNGRHLSNIEDHVMDDKAKLLSHSTIKGFGNDPSTNDRNLKITENEKYQTNTIYDDDDHKHTHCESKNKKDIFKDQKVKKGKEEPVHHYHHGQDHPKTVTFRVPPKHKRVQQQPGFNLDYSPPKTHPPSHN